MQHLLFPDAILLGASRLLLCSLSDNLFYNYFTEEYGKSILGWFERLASLHIIYSHVLPLTLQVHMTH